MISGSSRMPPQMSWSLVVMIFRMGTLPWKTTFPLMDPPFSTVVTS
jgi:hypothetical protein